MKNDPNEIILIDYKSDALREQTLLEIENALESDQLQLTERDNALLHINKLFICLQKTEPIAITRGQWNLLKHQAEAQHIDKIAVVFQQTLKVIVSRFEIVKGVDIVNYKLQNFAMQGFWDVLFKRCPDSVGIFCKWIDDYKLRVDWNKLFNSDSDWQDSNGKNAPAPKFHDLPMDIQTGILLRFFQECRGSLPYQPRFDPIATVGQTLQHFEGIFIRNQDWLEYRRKNK